MRWLALVLLAACSKDPAPLRVVYAASTENGADGQNATFFSINEDRARFAVAEGSGAGDPSRAAAHALADGLPACPPGDLLGQVRCELQQAGAAAGVLAIDLARRELVVGRRGDVQIYVMHGPGRIDHIGDDDLAEPLVLRQALAPGDAVALVNRAVAHGSPIEGLAPGQDKAALEARVKQMARAGAPLAGSAILVQVH